MINVLSHQSLLDIAIQESGSVLAAIDWAVANGVSITDELVPGQKINSVDSQYKNTDVANYLKSKGQNIATDNIIKQIPIGFPYGFPIQF